MSAVAKNPIKTLEQLINLAELVHHPDGDAELTDDARKALGEMKALEVAFRKMDEEYRKVLGLGEEFRDAALVPFGKEGP